MRRICLIAQIILLFSPAFAQITTDTTEGDCYEAFFSSGTKVANQSKILLTLKNKKTVSVSNFLKQNPGIQNYMTLKDLDRDGTKELIIYNFTGGAHCCDEFYFFRNTAPNRYQLTNKIFAGHTCVDKDTFYFSFTEPFGYFFTCYACGLSPDDKATSNVEYVYGVGLKYVKGKLQILRGDEELRQKINNNLEIISKLKWDGGAGDEKFDDGRRKEVALNLATYYYSFGKNINDTKSLFYKYYKFKDANKVWTDFFTTLRHMMSTNDF